MVILPPSYLTLLLDVSPSVWSLRASQRTSNDLSKPPSESKGSSGPTTLPEYINTILTFLTIYKTMHIGNELTLVLFTGSEAECVYDSMAGGIKGGGIEEGVCRKSVEDFLERVYRKAEGNDGNDNSNDNNNSSLPNLAAAFSLALALTNLHLLSPPQSTSSLLLTSSSVSAASYATSADTRLQSMMEGGKSHEQIHTEQAARQKEMGPRIVTPRVLIVQAGGDDMTNYNSVMNCVFAAKKLGVVVDGLFLPGATSTKADDNANGSSVVLDSILLQQAAALTDGIYMPPPKNSAQLPPLLLQVLTTVYLPSPGPKHESLRTRTLNVRNVQKVDYRGRCFTEGKAVDMAWVCNVCLSVVGQKIGDMATVCETCECRIVNRG